MKIAFETALPVEEILAALGDRVRARCGPRERAVTAAAGLADDDAAGVLSFCSAQGGGAEAEIAASTAAVILCRGDVSAKLRGVHAGKTLIGVDNPRLAFIEAIALRSAMPGPADGIALSARVAASAVIGDEVRIGEVAVVGEDCAIGAGARIDAGVVLYERTRIGARCTIQAGAVIGAEGYGFERDDTGCLHRFPHFGRVTIEDEVEVGARTCIDRGALGDTRIGRGTKIDDAAYIAHNVRVGRDCLIMAQTVLCGSCVVGHGVEISPGAVIRDKVRIGDGARIGLGAVVVKDVPEGATVAGIPARPLRDKKS